MARDAEFLGVSEECVWKKPGLGFAEEFASLCFPCVWGRGAGACGGEHRGSAVQRYAGFWVHGFDRCVQLSGPCVQKLQREAVSRKLGMLARRGALE